jgi:hypothetical protein
MQQQQKRKLRVFVRENSGLEGFHFWLHIGSGQINSFHKFISDLNPEGDDRAAL